MSDNREESLYYLKIVFMYIELGTEVVLNTFVHHTPKKDAKLFLDSNQEKLQQLRRKKILNAEEYKLVFSPSPNPEDFDISLLITLSINLFSKEELPPPKEGWSYPPKDGDTSIAADLLRLRTLRNVIVGHKSKARLPKWRFEREWETVSEIFLRIYRAIAPANETQLKDRLNAYKQQRLEPCIENRYDAKLKEWHDEISKIQDEVEKSIQKLQDFDKYFKSKSNRYERYIKLLVKGGRLVLSAFLEKKTKSQSESLQETLKRKEDVIRSKINNVNHLRVLYPSDHETTLKAIDTSTWRIPLLANVILHLFGDQLDEPCCDAVRTINAAYENHAEVAFAALDSDNFDAYSSDLQHGLKSLQYHLDEQSKTDCKNILEEYKLVQKGDETRTTYFDELKAQGMQIKSIADVHKEMLRKTTETVQHMVTHGIEFKNDHVVDLKIVPHGTDEEKKLMAENVLTKILQAVLEGSGDICDHPTLKEKVEKFLKDITEWISNKRAHVRQKCIVLSVVCSSPNEILDLLTFFESTMFRAHLDSISQELGYQFNTVFKLEANVTAESLEEILHDKDPEFDKAHGVTIPITVSSLAAMVELRSYLKSKSMMSSASAISDHLSTICNDKITVEVSQDRTSLSQALEDLDACSSSSDIASKTSHFHKLKREDFHITTTHEADIRRADMADMKEAEKMKRDLEKTVEDLLDTVARSKAFPFQTGNEVEDDILRQKTKYETKEQEEKRDDIDHRKARFQKRLVKHYMEYTLKVSSIPLQPENNQTDIAEVYVSPWMTVEEWDETSKQNKEIEISLHEIFSRKEKPSKYIYILGEAGSGKSALCKCLVFYWCVAHSERTSTTKSEAVKEMENYDFLFHISLRHFSDLRKIEVMLNEIYHDEILSTILQTESDKCLILLDGLDEWTPQNQRFSQVTTKRLPERDLLANYTIITTTRRSNFDSLKLPFNEIHKKIQLKGIAGIAIKDLTKTTVKILNEIFHKNKCAEDFERDLQKSPVADVSHIPMILQQLICLWFDGRLRGTSKCSVYSSMLDLFFDWKALKQPGSQVQSASGLETDSKLPEYLCEYEACYDNTSVICHLARLAYKTLLTSYTKETLIFTNSTFQHLKIPDDVKMCSLNAGILSENLNESLFASSREQSSFSFVHKSMQEFLAAVHISMEFEKKINSSDVSRKGSDNFEKDCKESIDNHFKTCKTAVGILKQSNVFIMLCGLESKLLPYITEYIFNVIKVDEHMIKERNNLPANYNILCLGLSLVYKETLKASIQKRILSCINEASLEENFPKNSIYIADVVPSGELMRCLQRQIFNLHSVVCLDVDLSSSYIIREQEVKDITTALKLLTDIRCLKAFRYYIPYLSSEQQDEQVVQIISRNKTTLECVRLICIPAQTVRTLVQIIPAMSHLISIQIDVSLENMTVPHEIYTSLCTYLEQSVHLQNIRLKIFCREPDEHSINLSQHQQLHLLDIEFSSMFVTSLNTNSLHTCRVRVDSGVTKTQLTKLCDSLYKAHKLKCLSLLRLKPLHNYAEARSDTENLIRLLPSLTSLVDVELEMLAITDNIIRRPWDMKSLQVIILRDVGMSMTTWCQFVDNISTLPHIYFVRSVALHIIDTTCSIEYSNENVERIKKAHYYFKEKFEGLSRGFFVFVYTPENRIASIN